MFTFSFNFKQTHELLFNHGILFLSHNAPPTLIVSLILLPGFVSPLDFNPECFPPSHVPLRRQPSFHSLPKLIWTLWSNRIRRLSKRLLLQARTWFGLLLIPNSLITTRSFTSVACWWISNSLNDLLMNKSQCKS